MKQSNIFWECWYSISCFFTKENHLTKTPPLPTQRINVIKQSITVLPFQKFS